MEGERRKTKASGCQYAATWPPSLSLPPVAHLASLPSRTLNYSLLTRIGKTSLGMSCIGVAIPWDDCYIAQKRGALATWRQFPYVVLSQKSVALCMHLCLQRSPLLCANIVKKDPGRARRNSLATARTNFTKPGAQNKGDLCTCTLVVPKEDMKRACYDLCWSSLCFIHLTSLSFQSRILYKLS